MKTSFSEYFANDEGRLSKLWDDSLIVVDTNVLLDLYRYSDSARGALFGVLEGLSSRLWIPHQVGREYFLNRVAVVLSQAKSYSQTIANLKAIRDGLNVPNKHPFVEGDVFAGFSVASNRLIDDLEGKYQSYRSRVTQDDIKNSLSVLLDGKVGASFSSGELEEIVREGDVRFSANVPPGYEDAGKFKDAETTDLKLKKYGDLILWQQILQFAKAEGRSVLLVTGEKKKDWWSKNGDDLIGPLPELVKEFNDVVGKDFYLFTTDRFMEQAGAYLKKRTSQAVIDEIKAIRFDEEEIEGNKAGGSAASDWLKMWVGGEVTNEWLNTLPLLRPKSDPRMVRSLKRIRALETNLEVTFDMISALENEIGLTEEKGGPEKFLDVLLAQLSNKREEYSTMQSELREMKSVYSHYTGESASE